MAGHALDMIKSGATLKTTIRVLADTEPKKLIVKKIYDNRDKLPDATAASEMGGEYCKQLNARL